MLTGKLSYVINDSKGARLAAGRVTGSITQIDLSMMAGGVYYLQMTSENGERVWQEKIVKQ